MSDGSIRLSTKYGINPALVKCRSCGKETGEIALLGGAGKYVCSSCGYMQVGRSLREQPLCPRCNLRLDWQGEYDGSRGVVGLCDECRKKEEAAQAVVDAEVRRGGIYWRCKDCSSSGAIKAEAELAKRVRAHMKLPTGPCGLEFNKTDCPVCGPQPVGDGVSEGERDQDKH